MATRELVENLISTNVDSGRASTAEEVREVLTALLDYTENDAVSTPSDLEYFDSFDEGNYTQLSNNQDSKIGEIWYSFRGFKEKNVNFTFRLKTNSKSETTYFFKVPDDTYAILKDIINPNVKFEERLSFSIPIRDNIGKNEIEIATIGIHLSDQNRVVLTFESEFERSRPIKVYTSLQFHAPKFI